MNANRPFFFLPYFALLAILGWVLCTSEKLQFHLWLHEFHNSFLDCVIPYCTHLGDGIFVLSIALMLLLLYNQRTGILLILGYVFSSVIAQLLKRLAFPDYMRPFHFFKNNVDFHQIPNFLYFESNGFPSGHTTSAFAFATVFCYLHGQKPWVQFLLFGMAVFVGFTRVYLSQHFLLDVYFGSILGVVCGWMLLRVVPKNWFPNTKPMLTRWKK